MSPSLRLATVVVCVTLAARGVGPGFSLASLDVWNWSDAYGSLARAQERATALAAGQDRLTHSYQAKRALGAELAAG